jgi:hypothetical protein
MHDCTPPTLSLQRTHTKPRTGRYSRGLAWSRPRHLSCHGQPPAHGCPRPLVCEGAQMQPEDTSAPPAPPAPQASVRLCSRCNVEEQEKRREDILRAKLDKTHTRKDRPRAAPAWKPTGGQRRPREGGRGMSDESSVDIDVLDVSDLSASDVTTLADSALGHAVRRALTSNASGANLEMGRTIAAHDSHV